jgi:hypothetical protein
MLRAELALARGIIAPFRPSFSSISATIHHEVKFMAAIQAPGAANVQG